MSDETSNSARSTEKKGIDSPHLVTDGAGPNRQTNPELLEELVENAKDGLFILDADGHFDFCNESFAALLGYEKNQLLGAHAAEILSESEFETVRKEILERLETGTDEALIEVVLERVDGTQVAVVINVTIRETGAGEYAGMLGVARDVTDRKHRAQELKRYETIVQAVSEPICTLNADGRFCSVNDSFETVTGYERDTAIDETLELVFNTEDADALQAAIVEIARTGGKAATTVEGTIQTSDGETVPTECRLTTLPTAEPRPAVVAVLHDITRLKEREQRLSKFASVVSHDLRNPMDVALGRAEMLPRIADVDESTERHLDDIYDSLKRMERLIEDVLTLSRQRDERIDTEALSLQSVAEMAWTNVATESATLSIDADRPIQAHEDRLSQLLENLFRNAIQHGGEDVTVTVSLTDSAQQLAVRVSDDGAGIPDEHKQQIFEDGFTTTRDGTGLGLAIVDEIARAHGWEVEILDTEDSGADFQITGIVPAENS